MTAPVATKIYINDIPVQLSRPMEFRLSRGWEPWKLAIPVSDQRFDNLQNPVTIRIETQGVRNNEVKPLLLENWYITEKVRNDEYLYDLIVQDARWAAQYQKLTASYNMTWWGFEDGTWRQDSIDPTTNTPWRAVDAIKDALEKFGLTVDDNPDLSARIQGAALPNNLGNSPGGGFMGASYFEAMPLLAETLGVDPIMKPNGHVMLVDRVSDRTKDMNQWRPIAGRVEVKENKWSTPNKLVVLFGKRIERRWEFVEASAAKYSAPTPYAGNGFDGHIENVIPEFQANGEIEGGNHVEFYGEVEDNVKYSYSNVLDRIRSTALFPWGQGIWQSMSAQDYFKYRWFEVQMQECWRRRYRVKKEAFQVNEIFRPFANMQLGRLNIDGTTKSNSAVHMDYVKINRYSHYAPGKGPDKGGSIFDAEFSENISLDFNHPAPFDAQWLTDDADELIFEITPRVHKVLDRDYWPGLLKKSMQFGDVQDIADGKPIQALESSTEFRQGFQLYVFYHGLQIADIPSVGSPDGDRAHYRTFAGPITNGTDTLLQADGPTLYIRADDITANYRFNPQGYPTSADLLNGSVVEARAHFIRDQVIESYLRTKHGSVTFAGVAAITDGKLITGGNIYDTVIQIGFQQEFDCLVSYLVLPQIAQIYSTPRRLDGVEPRLVEA